MKNLFKDLRWLWAMWRAKRIYSHKHLLFSERERFMLELRPRFRGSDETRVAYPDAIMFIMPRDVDRALSVCRVLTRHSKWPLE